MWGLLEQLVEEMSIIVTLAFILTRLKIFRLTYQQKPEHKGQLLLIAVFGFFGLISSYTGFVTNSDKVSPISFLTLNDFTIANTRPAGIVVGGLIGGPIVGLVVGCITSIPRIISGDFTYVASTIAYLISGLLVGWIGEYLRKKGKLTVYHAFLTGALAEIIHVGFVLILAQPYVYAIELLRFVAVPMILINALGSWLFALIFENVLQEEEKTRAFQTHEAFLIADRTLPYFRQGLNEHSSKQVAKIILDFTGADAISITNQSHAMAHVGLGENHHLATDQLVTRMTKQALDTGKRVIARSRHEIGCLHPQCPLHAAIALPLIVHENVVGTLTLYFSPSIRLGAVQEELAEGLSKLFSTQLELGEMERQAKLLRDAEIKALQAQVNPHFLFNAINTIVAVCRQDAMLARKLLLDLSTYFRRNLQGARQVLIPLYKEIEHVDAYISIEKARYPGRYTLELDLEPGSEHVLIPPFILQPLVENAIMHGVVKSKEGAEVKLQVRRQTNQVEISVTDNGSGIPECKLLLLGKQTVPSTNGTGTALHNIFERLKGIYGNEAFMTIESRFDYGTHIEIKLPIRMEGE